MRPGQSLDSLFIAAAFITIACIVVRIANLTNRPTARPLQFSLGSLLVAVAFIAAACGAVRFNLLTYNPIDELLAALAVPIFVGGAVGVLRGRLPAWLGYGVAVDFSLMAAMLAWLTFRAG